MNSPGRQVPNTLQEIGGEITPERMKGWNQRKKLYPVGDVTGDRSKVRCCKELYCIRTRNDRFMKPRQIGGGQTVARVNVDILGVSELKWTGMGEFNSDDHYI